MLNAACRVLCAVISAIVVVGVAVVGAVIMTAACAEAAMVRGVYTSRGGATMGDHQLHFENVVSGDIFLTRTGSDGSFASDLPPGTYDLRAERGLILAPKIVVGTNGADVGRVTDGSSYDVRRPFERQGIGPALVDTGAPATAHVAQPSGGSDSSAALPPQSAATFWSPASPTAATTAAVPAH